MENKLLAAARHGERLRADVDKVAEIASVPPTRRGLFCTALIRQILSARRAGALWRRPDWIARFEPISDHAVALRDCVRRLGERDRVRSEVEKQIAIGGSGMELKVFLGALDAVAKRGKALSALQQRQKPHGRKAPRKLPFRPGSCAADEFPVMLQALVMQYSGKRLSLYKYGRKPAGKLVKALRLLAPHLGKGFEERWTYKVLRRLELVDLPESNSEEGRANSCAVARALS